jgi:uridine kinase
MKENEIKEIKITLPDGNDINVPSGISLLELSKDFESEFRSTIVAAKVDNDIKELNFSIINDCRIKFIDLTNEDGMRIYRRSLHFILIKSVYDLFPERKVTISHSISKGVYCEIKGDCELTEIDVYDIETRMRELVNAKIPFIKRLMSVEDAKNIFSKSGRTDRLHAIEHRTKPYVTIYKCDDLEDYFYGYMVPDTGYVNKFALKYYKPGLIIQFPEKSNPDILPEFEEQKKLFNIFMEYKQWGHILGIDNISELNDMIKGGQVNEIVRISEALHEKKIAQIADKISGSQNKKRIVLISGPSSSGKTTFAHRLAIQLRVNGLKPVTISLDDYFVNREETPVDEKGDYDYEALEAIDVKLFNQHLAELICGKEVEIPIFNFPNGCRDVAGRKLCINDENILVVEGIHGLNEKLTAKIPRESKFKIYVSALTSMNIDDHNRIPSTDTRIIRRIVRDFQFRGCNALNTIKRWSSVRRGEDKNIFPFQEEADIMFNSSLVYELGVLKKLAEPLLLEVESSNSEYSEARRLIEFLSYFLPIETGEIPPNSIIREFAGGSCFY